MVPMTLVNILPTLQVIIAVLLIIAILLQQSEESLGGAFGGSDNTDTVTKTRRGADKVMFQGTIVLAVLFTLTSIALLVV
jgi:preprotein translocase subunit SecG